MLLPLWMKQHTHTSWILCVTQLLTYLNLFPVSHKDTTTHRTQTQASPRSHNDLPAARVPMFHSSPPAKIMRRFVQVTLAIKDKDGSHTRRFSQWQGGVHAWFTRNHFSHFIRFRYSAARKVLKIHRCTENKTSVSSCRKMFPSTHGLISACEAQRGRRLEDWKVGYVYLHVK